MEEKPSYAHQHLINILNKLVQRMAIDDQILFPGIYENTAFGFIMRPSPEKLLVFYRAGMNGHVLCGNPDKSAQEITQLFQAHDIEVLVLR